MNRCPNCMNELTRGTCSACGYPQVKVAQVRGALPCHTMLLSQLEVGDPLGQSYQSIAYIAYDHIAATPVIVLEFYPRQVAARSGAEVTVQRNADLYMDACQQYLTSTQTQPLPLLRAFACNNTVYRVYQLQSPGNLAARDAELLLDQPILFRNAQGVPMMSVNALVIPPMPAQRAWQPGERIVSERRRRKINQLVGVSVAALVLALGGVFAYDIIREHDVTVRVMTDAPIVQAHLGSVALPAATPDAEGGVTYHARMRKGTYDFEASNSLSMSLEQDALSVPTQADYTLSIPTPSPTPVPAIVLQAGEWIYQQGEQFYIVSDTLQPTVSRPDSATSMANIHVTAAASLLEDPACTILLCRDQAAQPLTWVEGMADFAVSEGDYTLMLRYAHQEPKLLASFSAAQDQTITLNADAISFYCNYLSSLSADQPLFYVGDHASVALDGTDAAGINAWADEYPALFGAYRQHTVTFSLDPRLSDQAQVTINGLNWVEGDAVTLCEGMDAVSVIISTGALTIPAETVAVDLSPTEPILLGQTAAELSATRWQDAIGLMHTADGYYLLYAQGAKLLDEASLTSLASDIQLAPQSFAFSMDEVYAVSVELDPSVAADAIQTVTLMDHPLAAGAQPLCYELEVTPGEYDLTITFRNAAAPVTEHISVSADGQTFPLMKGEVTRLLGVKNALSNAGMTGLIRTSRGYAYLPADLTLMGTDADVTAPQLIQYAQIYDLPGMTFTLSPVQIALDQRLLPSILTQLTLGGHTLSVSADHTVDVTEMTPGEYTLGMTLAEGSMQSCDLTVSGEGTTILTLLTETADQAVAQLRFWGQQRQDVTLQAPAATLTESAIAAAREQADIWQVWVVVPEDLTHCTFSLRYTADPQGELILRPAEVATATDLATGSDLATVTELTASTTLVSTEDASALTLTELEFPAVEGYVTAGFYTLYVTYEGQQYAIRTEEIDSDRIIRLLHSELDTILPIPTPTPTPEPTERPHIERTATPSPTATLHPGSTAAVTVTPSPTRTATPASTATASATATFSVTPSPTPTATPTATPSPSPTPTPTLTATPTAAPTPTPTPTPTVTDSTGGSEPSQPSQPTDSGNTGGDSGGSAPSQPTNPGNGGDNGGGSQPSHPEKPPKDPGRPPRDDTASPTDL